MITTDKEETTKEYVQNLSLDSMARWICLIRGVRTIFNKMDEMGEDIESSLKNKRFFNRIERSLNAYIEEQFLTVKSDIELGHQKLVDTFDIFDEELI